MTKITISQLIWDEWNTKHIQKHSVTVAEVEEGMRNIRTHSIGYAGRVILIGRAGKRILAILVAPQSNKTYYLVTVRDADKKERGMLYEKEKNDNTKV